MKRLPYRVTKRVTLERLHREMKGDMARLAKAGAVASVQAADEIDRRARANAPVRRNRPDIKRSPGFYRRSISRANLRGVAFAGAKAPYSARLEPGPRNRPSRQAPRGIFDLERRRIEQTLYSVMTNILRGVALAGGVR